MHTSPTKRFKANLQRFETNGLSERQRCILKILRRFEIAVFHRVYLSDARALQDNGLLEVSELPGNRIEIRRKFDGAH